MFSPRRWLYAALLLLCSFFPTAAQTTENPFLSPPIIDDFPIIRAYMELYDDDGSFIHDLDPLDVTVVEDNVSIFVDDLGKIEVGTQFLIALNQGPPLAIQDSNGVSRYDTIAKAISSWAEIHSAKMDDLNFLTNEGIEYLHLRTGDEWLSRFQTFEPDSRNATPSLDVLVRAVEVATEPQNQPGKGKSILLITPPPDRPPSATIQNIIAIANREKIRIHVWMVSSTELFDTQGAEQLAELANNTGGDFLAFSGEEVLPEIQTYLDPLRYVYLLSYRSGIRNSDPHSMFVRIRYKDTQIESDPLEIDLQILPPNPIFLSPPLEIIRENVATLSETLSEIDQYTPENLLIEILIEFSDGIPRPLVRSTLYDNGVVVDQRTSEPFDKFNWDLRPYESTDRHLLQVEVVDSLGLRNTTIPQPIDILVKQSPQKIFSILIDNAPIIAGATTALAGSILLLVLVINGHIQPRSFGKRRRKRSTKEIREKDGGLVQREPLIQKSDPSSRKFPNWSHFFWWTHRKASNTRGASQSQVVAYLEHLDTNGVGRKVESIPLKIGTSSFGKDPSKAMVVLDDKALNDLHAKLVLSPDLTCHLYDEGSIAGTWLNFSQVSKGGEKVHHGDIIHIGRIGLCYKVADKSLVPKPIILPMESFK